MGRHIRNSYGLACFRRSGAGELELMVVNKRYTYAFCDFVYGRYDAADDATIQVLVDKMTANEKVLLLHGNFAALWFWLWVAESGGPRPSAEAQFRSAFGGANGQQRLRRLVERARSHGQCRWEMPKGRLVPGETQLECAIREFEEETGIRRGDYKIVPMMRRQFRHQDAGITYQATFFVGLAKPWTSASAAPPREISEARWFRLEDIKSLSDALWKNVKPLFHYVRNHYSSEYHGRSSHI